MTAQQQIDERKLEEFVGQFAADLGAATHAATVLIGDELGLYRAMAEGERLTAADLAGRTGTDERYIQEWLSAVGAAAHVKESLKPDGTWMIVEPFAGDRLEDNLNAVGRIFYSASTTICVPNSKDQDVGLALGAQAGEARVARS